MCVQWKRWSVVCGCVLHRGQRGEVWFGAGRGCDVFLWVGRVLKGGFLARFDVLVMVALQEVCVLC